MTNSSDGVAALDEAELLRWHERREEELIDLYVGPGDVLERFERGEIVTFDEFCQCTSLWVIRTLPKIRARRLWWMFDHPRPVGDEE